MHNITLISTIHSENGQCNSDELYKILKDVHPEVIFDELPKHISEMFYNDSFEKNYANNILLNRRNPTIPLEVECIKKYKQNYNVKIIPVDIDLRNILSENQDDIFFMYLTFLKYEDYKNLDNEKNELISDKGFNFLNSSIFLDFLEKKEIIEKNIIESDIHKNRLLNIYELFHKEQYDIRENTMLQNIYNYSKENKYNQAVFLIGAEHKKSIMSKIIKFEKLSEIKLNWTMYWNK
ncbi:hypothetical protein [Flavobacterium sp.]|uniref:hypothetical protein n=1 Tax=Flavobacterium sp. TaxID=239 RepID=UPI002616C805|nr:hypothetical protein [Flavobacterium sp.]